MSEALRVRVAGDVRPIVQEGRLKAFFLGETEVPVAFIREYRENAIYFVWTPQSKTREENERLILAFLGWESPAIRLHLPLENVTEYGRVRIIED